MKNEGQVFGAILKICEGREHNGSYSGNGHHLAQEIFQAVEIALLPKQRREVFDCLSAEWKTSSDISAHLERNFSTKLVSAILCQLYAAAMIDSKREKGVFYWRKLQ